MERMTREEQGENNVCYWCYKRKRSEFPQGPCLCPSYFLTSPLITWINGKLYTIIQETVVPCGFTDSGKTVFSQFVCFHGSTLIDCILQQISNMHIRLLPPAHYYSNNTWITDIWHHWGCCFFPFSTASQKNVPVLSYLLCKANGPLLLQLPHFHHERLAP